LNSTTVIQCNVIMPCSLLEKIRSPVSTGLEAIFNYACDATLSEYLTLNIY
jgi:hypothetical protein